MERTIEITISSDRTLETIGQCVKRVKRDLQNNDIRYYSREEIIKDLHFMISFIENVFMEDEFENSRNFEKQMEIVRKKIKFCLENKLYECNPQLEGLLEILKQLDIIGIL